ncbi:MAG: hypothetical protein CMI60_22205 [Parvibaculum sp.]|nr:hypothetical protein [Parvibaculum sp.]
MSTKIKKEELEKVQQINGELGQLRSLIGDVHIAQHNMNKREESLMTQWNEKNTEYNEYAEELRKEYGDVNIDIATGKISEPATPTKEVEDDNQADS